MKRLMIILLLLTACEKEVTVSTLPDQKMNATEKNISLKLSEVVLSESTVVIKTIVKTLLSQGELFHEVSLTVPFTIE